MTPEINQLLEEGIARSGELTDAADEAMNAIDSLVKGAEGLTARVQEDAHEVGQHLRDLVSRLDHAENELEGARGEAEGALDGLASKAVEVKAAVTDLLERVKKNMADLDAQHDRVDEALTGQMSSAQTDFADLAQKTHDLEEQTDHHLSEAAAALSAFRSAIDAARTELAHKREDWSAAMESLETHAHEQANAWVTGLQGLLTRQATAMVEAANSMVTHHNESMTDLKHRFVEQAPQELTSALAPLRTALESLGEDAGTRQQALSAHAQELGQAATQAESALHGIQADLASAAALE
jgi:DNA repair exonuclease SbcCD ATPase subunit